MPITQDRMLQLIQSGRTFQAYYESLRAEILRLTAPDRDKSLPDEYYIDACNQAARQFGTNTIGLQQAIEILTREDVHFKHARKRNEYTKSLAQAKRVKAYIEQHGDPALAESIYIPRAPSKPAPLPNLQTILNAPAQLEAQHLAKLGQQPAPKPTRPPLVDQTPQDPELVDIKGLDLGL